VRRALRGYLDGLVFAQPGGKRNSYASDVAAGYVVVERGTHPSVNALAAFLAPVRPGRDQDLMAASIDRLRDYLSAVRKAYGFDSDIRAFNGHPAARQGNAPPQGEVWALEELQAFVAATPLPKAAA
jgi:CRISPR system Cascade subunit CasC